MNESNTSIRWKVLDADKTNMGTKGMFLVSENLFGDGTDAGGLKFEADAERATVQNENHYYRKGTTTPANSYEGSDGQEWCGGFYNDNFTEGEQHALLETVKNDGEYSYSEGTVVYQYGAMSLNRDKVFFLSAREAVEYFGSYTARQASYKGKPNRWWLRSPSDTGDRNNVYRSAGVVNSYGVMSSDFVNGNGTQMFRPALNLNLDSVAFASDASGGIGTRALAPVSSNGDVTEWKLTLKDPSRDAFTAGTASSTTQGAGYTSWPVEVAYENAGTGDSEYVSAMLCDEAGNVLYYGDIAQNSAGGTAAFDIPSGLTAGRYTLRVFSEQRNGAYQTDYASAFQDIALNVLPQETMPDAVFTATSDSRGILSDVETTMKYSVDGGVTWNDITGATMEITGVTAEGDVKIYRPGDGATTSDSEVQTIDVTQAARPQGLDKVDCTTSERDDGQITGVDNTMEYRLSVDADWIPITDDMLTDGRLTGLSEGTYQVRVRAAGMVLASPYAEVTIGAHPAPAGTQEPSGSSSSSIAASGNKSGGTGVPQTGDDSNIAFWLAVMLAAGAAMSGTGIYRRKKKCGRC